MSRFWQVWLNVWCVGIAVFGIIITGGAFEETSGPILALYQTLSGSDTISFQSPEIRFSLAVMGAVSIGWAISLFASIKAAVLLGPAGKPIWVWTIVAAVVWYVVDSALSVMTGFALNVVPNTVLMVGFFVPVFASGVLKS